MVEMDQNGVIRRVIELEETEEDIAYEVRRLAERIHRALNPELFPDESANPALLSIDSLPYLEPPVGHVTALSRRRVGAPGPPAEPKPRPPSMPPLLRAPDILPPRMRVAREATRNPRRAPGPARTEDPLPAVPELYSFLPDTAYGAPASEEEPGTEPMNHSDSDDRPRSSADRR